MSTLKAANVPYTPGSDNSFSRSAACAPWLNTANEKARIVRSVRCIRDRRVMIFEFGSENRLPFSPAASRKAPMAPVFLPTWHEAADTCPLRSKALCGN